MIIAGMITSTVHKILATINYVVKSNGYDVLYNDTDSCCFEHPIDFNERDMNELVEKINVEIAPYTVESEGFGKTTYILSLKRYISEGGTGKTKIRLHGKGRYNIKEIDIYNFVVNGKIPDKELRLTQLAANTERSMKMILNLFPYLEKYKHPFMFVTDVPTDRTMEEFFDEWFRHIDTKTTFQGKGEFPRKFHKFSDYSVAVDYFTNFHDRYDKDSINEEYRKWDDELDTDFYTLDTIE